MTTDGAVGRWDQTVRAMCSVSARPPTLLVGLNRRSPLGAAVEANRAFAVSVLASGQAHVADTLAGRPAIDTTDGDALQPYDFACAEWDRQTTGCPGLQGAAAVFDSTPEGSTDSGTHRVFLGAVIDCVNAPAKPLTYAQRTYGRHAPS